MTKTIVITGATSGLGLASARHLSKQGHNLILLSRDPQKCEDVISELRGTGNQQLHSYPVDLGSLKEVREVGKQIVKNFKVDVLLNNAGIWNSRRILSDDGIEQVFAVNHLAYFLLTHLLYPSLTRSEDARVVNVGSDSHFHGKLYLDDISLQSNYHGLRSYAQSKLANVMFTYELDRRKREPHVVVNCLQPGLVKTDIGLKHTTWLHRLAWKFRRQSGVSSEEGARTQLYLATAPEAKGISGKYWDNLKPKDSSKNSYDQESAQKLWEISCQLCGISDFFNPEL